ncbi:hypothetical protein B7Z17_01800 [Candidatus Saccharibacteria bacterium 32-49-10]|nr:MAG: hypothetical protein B7Z17_01800 [Candidatus Saccharibacteria bacterium 32-49-10]
MSNIRWSIALPWTLIAAASFAGLFFLYQANKPVSPLPETIKSTMDFSPFVLPTDNPHYTSENFTYGAPDDKQPDVRVLRFVATSKTNSAKMTVTEQIIPDQFTDIPEYKEKFLEGYRSDTVQSANGIIYIGKKDNQEIGIMFEKGLMVFLYPEQTISKNEWRQFAETLEIVR